MSGSAKETVTRETVGAAFSATLRLLRLQMVHAVCHTLTAALHAKGVTRGMLWFIPWISVTWLPRWLSGKESFC